MIRIGERGGDYIYPIQPIPKMGRFDRDKQKSPEERVDENTLKPDEAEISPEAKELDAAMERYNELQEQIAKYSPLSDLTVDLRTERDFLAEQIKVLRIKINSQVN